MLAQLTVLAQFVAFFAFVNWLAGGNLRWRKRLGLPGRSIYYAGLLAIVVGWLTYGWMGAFVGLNFLLWRLPGWYGSIDAGLHPLEHAEPWGDDPTHPASHPEQAKILGVPVRDQRMRDFVVMSARGLLAFPVFVYAAAVTQSLTPLLVLAAASLSQGWMYDLAHRKLGGRNDVAEIMAGVMWGVAYFWLLA